MQYYISYNILYSTIRANSCHEIRTALLEVKERNDIDRKSIKRLNNELMSKVTDITFSKIKMGNLSIHMAKCHSRHFAISHEKLLMN